MTEPADRLMPFLLAVLIPFLTAGGIPDPDLARLAATETIAAYQAAGSSQLVTVAQIVAFALASLENLRLSAPQDLSLSMKLKLRGNATALNRVSQQATAALDAQRRDPPAAAPDPTEILASLAAAKAVVRQARLRLPPETAKQVDLPNEAAKQVDLPTEAATQRDLPGEASAQVDLPTEAAKPEAAKPEAAKPELAPASKPTANVTQADLAWAAAMTDVATRYSAELPNLPTAQQQPHLARIRALTNIAAMLGKGEAPPLKARLLGSTALRG
jgi:hypothetical protein